MLQANSTKDYVNSTADDFIFMSMGVCICVQGLLCKFSVLVHLVRLVSLAVSLILTEHRRVFDVACSGCVNSLCHKDARGQRKEVAAKQAGNREVHVGKHLCDRWL
jgi:hypothetical protein